MTFFQGATLILPVLECCYLMKMSALDLFDTSRYTIFGLALLERLHNASKQMHLNNVLNHGHFV